MWAAPSPGTLILLPGLHSVLEPPPQGGRLPRLGRCAQEGQVVLKGVCGGDAWQGRADWPTGWVTEGARAGVGQQDRPCYSAQSAQELAVAESITACGWRRGQGSLPLEG